jgi:hypothetical protein
VAPKTTESLRVPGQASPTATTRRSRQRTSARVDYSKAAVLLATVCSPTPLHPGHQDALTSQTHPLVPPRRIDVVVEDARPAGYSSRAARLNAARTAQSTKGRLARPAKVAHGPAPGSNSPPGDVRLSS